MIRRTIRLAHCSSALALAAALVAGPAVAQSFDGSSTVVFGSANVTTGSGTTDVNVSSPSAVIDWSPTDTSVNNGVPITFQPAGTTATFTGPAGGFALLNRIVPTDATRPIVFDGDVVSQLQGAAGAVPGGTVFFYSPGGIIVGANAVFDVGNLGLTTAAPIVDGSGNWYTGNQVQFQQAVSGSSVDIQPGAQITAPTEGSYVAAFAPIVHQGGTIDVNGQAALVAGEAGTITFSPDGLFDIQVTIGTDGDSLGTAIEHDGTTTGPAASGASAHRIYMVAVPKNQAISLAVSRGSSVGFDIAGAADTVGNTVVLSAGRNVSGGVSEVNQAGSQLADIQINDSGTGSTAPGIEFTSAVRASASGEAKIDTFNQTSFASDATLDSRTSVFVAASNAGTTPGQLSVAGNLTLSNPSGIEGAQTLLIASDGAQVSVGGNLTLNSYVTADGSGDGVATGGHAEVDLYTGSALAVGGNLVLDGSSYVGGPTAGSLGAQGGTAQVNLQDAGTLSVAGVTRIQTFGIAGDNNGYSGTGADGRGGTSLVTLANGSTATFSELNVVSNGIGGFDVGSGAGDGFGGFSQIVVDGAGSVLSVQNPNVTGQANLGQLDLIGAIGGGGATAVAGSTAGTGTGGSGTISVFNGGTVNLPTSTTGRAVTVLARGFGGDALADGATGGTGRGGAASISLDSGTMTAENLVVSSYGGGGFAGASITGVVNGGAGVGGTRDITLTNGSTFTGSLSGGGPSGVGGDGSASGTGGSGSGGQANLLIDNSTVNVTHSFQAFNQAFGGGGAVGGSASGGGTSALIQNGSTVNLASGARLFIGANNFATGNGSPITQQGGTATAGDASLTVVNSAVTGPGTIEVSAIGFGAEDAVIGGNAFGGSARLAFNNANVSVSDILVSADGQAGSYAPATSATSGIVSGNGTGGTAQLSLTASSVTANTLEVRAGGLGGAVSALGATGTIAGAGKGGNALLNTFGSPSSLTASSITVDASGEGGTVASATGTGGSGTGGSAQVFGGAGAALAVNGPVTVVADGVAGDVTAGSGNGGAATGGAAFVSAIDGGRISFADAVTVHSGAIGGSGGPAGGNGGNATARTAQVYTDNGGLLNFAGDLTIASLTEGGDGISGGAAVQGQANSGGQVITTALSTGSGTIQVVGNTQLLTSAVGGDGSGGGKGGNAFAGGAFIDASGTSAIAGKIQLAGVSVYSTATGGDGGDGLSGSTGGAGGYAANFGLQVFGNAGNGVVEVTGALSGVSYALGGAGGAGGASSSGAAGNGGAGGGAESGYIQLGTRSGIDTTTNAGGATFTNVGLSSLAYGGTGGAGGAAAAPGAIQGNGGDGGYALADGGVLLVRGSPVTANSVSIDGTAVGGDGGQGAAAGNGGFGQGGNVSLTASQRYLGTGRGSANIGQVLLRSAGIGGAGTTPGASYYTRQSGVFVGQSDITLGTLDFAATGDLAPNYQVTAYQLDPSTGQQVPVTVTVQAFPSELTVVDSSFTANSITMSTPGDLIINVDNSTMTTGDLSISAKSIVLPATQPTAPGKVQVSHSLSLAVAQGASLLTYTGFNTPFGIDLTIAGDLQVGDVSANGDLLFESTGGSLETGALSASNVTLTAAGDVSAGAIATPGRLDVTAGDGVYTGGLWSAGDAQVVSQDIDIDAAEGEGISAGRLALVSTNPNGMTVGGPRSQDSNAYILDNTEFGTLKAGELNILGTDTQGDVDMTIGDLSISGSQLGSAGYVAFGTGDPATLTPGGRIRVDGQITGTNMTADNSVEFYADSIEVNAESGGIALTGAQTSQGGTAPLGGIILFDANNIHVASDALLLKLRADPLYAGHIADLNAPATTSRPDGVISALGIDAYPRQTFYIQNTGTAALPAGFYFDTDSSDVTPPGNEDPTAPPVEVVINGKFYTPTGDVTGRAAAQLVIDSPDSDFAGFTQTSQINGCTLTGGGCVVSDSPPPVSQAEIAVLTQDVVQEQPFDTTSDEDKKEAEDDARAPISPPVVLINSRPLNPEVDVTDPVSGTGNPALIDSSISDNAGKGGKQ